MTFFAFQYLDWALSLILVVFIYALWLFRKRGLASDQINKSSSFTTLQELGIVLAMLLCILCALFDPRGAGVYRGEKPLVIGPQPLIVALDQSFSMGVEDGLNGQTRDERAKAVLSAFFERLSDFTISLWRFGDGVETVMPFTEEKVFLDFTLQEQKLSFENSDFNQLIQGFDHHFKEYGPQFRPLILIVSDGEHRGSLSFDSDQLLSLKRYQPLFLNAVVVGGSQGGVVPGGKSTELSRANAQFLKTLVGGFQGSFFDGNQSFEKVVEELTAALKNQQEQSAVKGLEALYAQTLQYPSYAYLFIIVALFLLSLHTVRVVNLYFSQ